MGLGAIAANRRRTPPGPPPPPRYWRMLISGSNGAGGYVGALEIELAIAAGGADQTNGGTAFSQSAYGGLPASAAFDGTSADWASNNVGFPEWIGYDFGAGNGKDIVEVRWTPRVGVATSQSPSGFDVQSSADGVTYTHVWSVPAIAGWTDGVTKIFNRP